MACPYFRPEGKLDSGPWTHEPRWPLGAAFAGVCLARSGERHQPSFAQQEEFCNCGYARGMCERFPLEGGADAVRFSITADKPKTLRLVYIFEKNHAPMEFGALAYTVVEGILSGAQGEVVRAQAQAFVANYLAQTRAAKSANKP